MKWPLWFRLYVGIVAVIVAFYRHQSDPGYPLICDLGLGFLAAILMPGLVMGFVLVGHVGDASTAVTLIGSAIFWAIVGALCNRKKPAPAPQPSGGVITVVAGKRRRSRMVVR